MEAMEEKQSWLRRNWKLVINLVTFIALAFLIFATRSQIGDTFTRLRYVNGWILLTLIPIELLNYHAQARLYQRLFKIVGNQVSYKFLFRAALELNFVNHVFPSGGVTGISYFTVRMRKSNEITSGKATLVHAIKIALYVLAFEVALAIGVICLAAMGRVNGLVILVASSLSTLLLVFTVLFIYVVGSRSRINSFLTYMTKLVNSVIHLVRPSYPETINIEGARRMFDDFHNNFNAIKQSYPQLKAPFWYALLCDFTEIAAIYAVYAAFDKFVNVGAVILAYGIANFAGLVSVVPGGVGIYEALMTIVLAAAGIKPGVSLPITVTYRILNTILQLPPGYVLYQQALRQTNISKPKIQDAA
jgi:uncharacterized protein (TIRG00374 family)